MPTLRARVRDKLTGLVWPFVWVAILLTAGGVSLRAVSIMTRNPPLPDCTQVSVPRSDSEKLLCADASVRSGSAQALVAAIKVVEPWQPNHPLYQEADQRMNRWSKALLIELESLVQKGDRAQALEIAQRIPKRVDNYPAIKSAIATWNKEWSVGQTVEADITKAIEARDWITARRGLKSLKILGSDYWVRARHNQLKAKIDREEASREQLKEARQLAKTGDLAKLGEALAVAKQINLETTAWTEAKPDLETWSQQVMQYSFQKWEAEDIDGAIKVAQLVPPDLAVTAEAKDLLSFGHAQRLAQDADGLSPSYGQIYSLSEAIQAAGRISADSPFYLQAQESLEEWQSTLDDMVQLQYANQLASLGQESAYRWAIGEAQKVTQERPRRLQAQTLISHWHKEIQRIEDQPILNQALQMANAGNKESFQQAIEQAQKVELGRALRVDAQTYIAEWEDRIETIEDQPIITAAEQLAQVGKLAEAIAQAGKVKSGRALHDDAQVAIKAWTKELQTIEDRPILLRADRLAARGRLSDAIAVAAQIGFGRALYEDAQASIAIWDDERQYIWALRAEAESTADYYGEDYGDAGYSDSYTDSYDNY